MRFLSVDARNVDVLLGFLENIGDSSKSFRYYAKRKVSDVLQNHLTTQLLLVNDSPVAYGHLDGEGDDVWLGICVKESEVGKGYGKLMMKRLISSYDGDIVLSVDQDNEAAISLYMGFGFRISHSKNSTLFMRKPHDTRL